MTLSASDMVDGFDGVGNFPVGDSILVSHPLLARRALGLLHCLGAFRHSAWRTGVPRGFQAGDGLAVQPWKPRELFFNAIECTVTERNDGLAEEEKPCQSPPQWQRLSNAFLRVEAPRLMTRLVKIWQRSEASDFRSCLQMLPSA